MKGYKQNLHTHTTYCDGKNTPREMIERAIELGFDTIGFSGHSNTKLGIDWHMTEEGTKAYKEEIASLKAEYADRICVLCGLEYEMYSGTPMDGFDYIIGSLHFVKTASGYVDFDGSAEGVRDVIDEHFGGEGMRLAKAYYEQFAELHKYGNFDIVGHFDLVTKHCEKHNFFDTDAPEYRKMALESLHAIAEKHKVFEINTGVISRGYKTAPYPAPFILKEMKNIGSTVVITADCHKKEHLGVDFGAGLELAKSCGFTEIGVIRNGKIVEEKIEKFL